MVEGEPFQEKKGPDHVFARSLGLSPDLGPDPAVKI
jgi:hypothetical protein